MNGNVTGTLAANVTALEMFSDGVAIGAAQLDAAAGTRERGWAYETTLLAGKHLLLACARTPQGVTSGSAVRILVKGSTPNGPPTDGGLGTISGTVTSAGFPLAGISVAAVADSGTARATTAPDGSYSLRDLASDRWTVCFDSPDDSYTDGCYRTSDSSDGVPSSPVQVTAGHDTSHVDADLLGAGRVAGTVTDDQGHPVAGVSVTASSGSTAMSATTGADGTYSVTSLPAGDYAVCFDPPTVTTSGLTQAEQCWLRRQPGDDPTPVSVEAGHTATGIDAALTTFAAIRGTVTAAGSSQPLAGVSVTASRVSDPAQQYFGITGEHGEYVAQGLASGDYEVCFYPAADDASNYVAQCYRDRPVGETRSQDAVTATAGSATSGVDAALAPSGSISGMVTQEGHAAAGVTVQAVATSGSGALQDATAASDGSYSLTGLPAGTYAVCFYPPTTAGSATSISGTSRCYQQRDAASPDPVAVTAGNSTTDVNADLAAPASVAGTISTADGPLAAANVEVRRASDGATTYATTNSAGSYSATGLTGGTYIVCAYPASAEPAPYLPRCRDDAGDGPVTVQPGQSVDGLDVSLTTAGAVTGTVTDLVSGQPLGGVEVDAFPLGSGTDLSVTTAQDGTYSLPGLVDADYQICFYPPPGHRAECHVDQPADGTGSPATVTLASGTGVSGLDAALDPEN